MTELARKYGVVLSCTVTCNACHAYWCRGCGVGGIGGLLGPLLPAVGGPVLMSLPSTLAKSCLQDLLLLSRGRVGTIPQNVRSLTAIVPTDHTAAIAFAT